MTGPVPQFWSTGFRPLSLYQFPSVWSDGSCLGSTPDSCDVVLGILRAIPYDYLRRPDWIRRLLRHPLTSWALLIFFSAVFSHTTWEHSVHCSSGLEFIWDLNCEAVLRFHIVPKNSLSELGFNLSELRFSSSHKFHLQLHSESETQTKCWKHIFWNPLPGSKQEADRDQSQREKVHGKLLHKSLGPATELCVLHTVFFLIN